MAESDPVAKQSKRRRLQLVSEVAMGQTSARWRAEEDEIVRNFNIRDATARLGAAAFLFLALVAPMRSAGIIEFLINLIFLTAVVITVTVHLSRLVD